MEILGLQPPPLCNKQACERHYRFTGRCQWRLIHVPIAEHPLTQAGVEMKSKDVKNDDQNKKKIWVENLLANEVKTDRQSIIIPIDIFSI